MNRRKISIGAKMIALIISVVLVVFIFSFGYVSIKFRNSLTSSSEQQAWNKSAEQAGLIQAYFNNAFEINRTMVNTFKSLRKNGNANRSDLNNTISDVLEKNKNLLSIWMIWEPNAFDGKDSAYVNKWYYGETGLFNTGFYKAGGKILVEEDPSGFEEEDFFVIPTTTKKETVLEPYSYSYTDDENEMYFETSVIVPILENTNLLGILGIDIDLKTVQEINNKTKLYDHGFSAVISNNLIIAAHPNSKLVESPLSELIETNYAQIQDAVKNGKSYLYYDISKTSGKKVLRTFTPIVIGSTTTPWSMMIEIPKDEIMQEANQSFFIIIIIGLIGLLIISIVIVWIARNITKPVISSVAFAKTIADGDLTATLQIESNDEIGELSEALNAMVHNLSSIVSGIKEGALSFADVSNQLKSISEHLSSSTSQQAASIEEVSASIEEMVSNIEQNSHNAMETGQLSIKISSVVESVGDSSKHSLNSVKEIASKINIINDIAFQTNILALNAAVEAARAGEHGKGFAVVAAEVRKLAERSRIAADEISHLSTSTLEATEKSASLIDELIPEIKKTSSLIQEISAASSEQNSGAAQINNAIQQLNSATQNNASTSEEMAANAGELLNQANDLRDMITAFKIK